MDQLVEAVQVVAVHEDLKGREKKGQPRRTAKFTNRLDAARTAARYPLPGLVFEERPDDGVERVDVPGLVHKMDSSEPGRKTVLLGDARKTRFYHIELRKSELSETPACFSPVGESPPPLVAVSLMGFNLIVNRKRGSARV